MNKLGSCDMVKYVLGSYVLGLYVILIGLTLSISTLWVIRLRPVCYVWCILDAYVLFKVHNRWQPATASLLCAGLTSWGLTPWHFYNVCTGAVAVNAVLQYFLAVAQIVLDWHAIVIIIKWRLVLFHWKIGSRLLSVSFT